MPPGPPRAEGLFLCTEWEQRRERQAGFLQTTSTDWLKKMAHTFRQGELSDSAAHLASGVTAGTANSLGRRDR